MLKKIIAFCLLICLLMTLLTACGETPAGNSSAPVGSMDNSDVSTDAGATTQSGDSTDTSSTGVTEDPNMLKPVGSTTSKTTTGGKTSKTTKKPGKADQYATPSMTISTAQEKKFSSLNGSVVKIIIHQQATKQPDNVKAFYGYIQKKYGVSLDYTVMGSQEQESKMGTMVAAGTAPDVIPIRQEVFLRYVYSNLLRPLDQYIVSDPAWTGSSLSYYKTNNKVYGIPRNNEMVDYMVWYNKTLFEEQNQPTPYDLYKQGKWTMDALVETAKNMTIYRADKKTVKTYGVGTWNYYVFLMANGGTGLTETSPGKFSITIDKAAEMGGLETLSELVNNNSLYTGDSYAGFPLRNVAMHIERPGAAIGNYDYYNKMEDEIGMAPLPMADDGKYYNVQGMEGYAISRTAKNPLGAMMFCYEYWKFFDYRYKNATSDVDIADRRIMMSDEHYAIYKEYIAKAKPTIGFMEGMSNWWWAGGIRDTFWKAIITEKKAPSAAVDSMKSILQDALKRTVG